MKIIITNKMVISLWTMRIPSSLPFTFLPFANVKGKKVKSKELEN